VFVVLLLPFVAAFLPFLTPLITFGIVPLLGERAFDRMIQDGTGHVAAAVGALVFVVSFGLIAAWLEYRYATRLVLRAAGAHRVRREDEPDLWRAVENLCIGAGLPLPRIYVIESAAANAFAAGVDPERASLVVTRGLLSLLERRELEAVVAHELSHIGNNDIRLNTTLAALVQTLRLPLSLLFRLHPLVGMGCLGVSFLFLSLALVTVVGWVFEVVLILFLAPEIADLSQAGFDTAEVRGLLLGEAALMFALSLYGFLILCGPFYVLVGARGLGLLVGRAVSREREFLADADAVLLTRDPEGLALALTKIGAAGGGGPKVDVATAHLYIADPLPARTRWWNRILRSHPPLEERVALLARMGSGVPPSALQRAQEAAARWALQEAERAARSSNARTPSAATAPPVGDGARSPGGPTAETAGTPMGETQGKRFPVETPERGGTFRIELDTMLYARPDSLSPQLAYLSSGVRVRVLARAGEFWHVEAPDGTSGYVLTAIPMTEV